MKTKIIIFEEDIQPKQSRVPKKKMVCAHTFMVIPNIQSNENSLPMRDRSMCHSNSIKPIDTNKREREKKYTYETTQM